MVGRRVEGMRASQYGVHAIQGQGTPECWKGLKNVPLFTFPATFNEKLQRDLLYSLKKLGFDHIRATVPPVSKDALNKLHNETIMRSLEEKCFEARARKGIPAGNIQSKGDTLFLDFMTILHQVFCDKAQAVVIVIDRTNRTIYFLAGTDRKPYYALTSKKTVLDQRVSLNSKDGLPKGKPKYFRI